MKIIKEMLLLLNWDLGFQDPATGLSEALINLYNVVSFLLVLVFVMVSYLFIALLSESLFNNELSESYTTQGLFEEFLNKTLNFSVLASMYKKDKYSFLKIYDISEYHTLEKIWTLFPSSILAFIIVPSFSVEYWLDPKVNPFMVVKVIGNQWYWSYECNVNLSQLGIEKKWDLFKYSELYYALVKTELNSLMDSEYFMNEIKKANPVLNVSYEFDMNLVEGIGDGVTPQRLLQVDNRLVLPVGVPIRFLITASDVLHCWAVPSLGVKVDAVPGRLSSFLLFIDRPGVFFGQCSELCGQMHGFMPIVVEAVPINNFVDYALTGLEPYDLLLGDRFSEIMYISDEFMEEWSKSDEYLSISSAVYKKI